jgi:hypothetical protein
MSAAVARAMKGLREVSDAIAEFREAEVLLKDLAASQTIAPEKREPTNSAPFAHPLSEPLAYPIPQVARKLGLHRRTIERRIADKTFKTVNMLGRRLVTAESVRAMFETVEGRRRRRRVHEQRSAGREAEESVDGGPRDRR